MGRRAGGCNRRQGPVCAGDAPGMAGNGPGFMDGRPRSRYPRVRYPRHVPGAHDGRIAQHARASVLVVR